MTTTPDDCKAKRLALARIAESEGRLELAGDENMAGEAIEKYLAVFRDALNKNGECDTYSDRRVGYHWCSAFVYYCCLQAGFTFPPKPVPEHRWTLGAAPAWYQWAVMPENDFFFVANDPHRSPEPGDIVLFNRLIEDKDMDHVGIVISVSANTMTTAEGNFHNRSGVFERSLTENINGFIRLTRY